MLSETAEKDCDVAIVGGGACGIAVLTRLLDKTKQGKNIRSVALFEKAKTIGPGLAYSEACRGTKLNMPSETMGLRADNPLSFVQWMRSKYPDANLSSYLPRMQYGEYLCSVKSAAHEEAEKLGVTVECFSSEVVAIDKTHHGYEVRSMDGGKLAASNVVLALGNFMAPKNPYLLDDVGYFPFPWPNERLKMIPRDASVGIVGTRLTAVDVANCLSENGHQGRIDMISRSGRLPKVQSTGSFKGPQYKLFELAREAEKVPNKAFDIVTQTIKAEIDSGSNIDWQGVLQGPPHAQEELEKDVREAEHGRIRWQEIIRATSPIVERYWKCFSQEEKHEFLKKYLSIWGAYRHAMPLVTAQKTLHLLAKGQLGVVKAYGKVQSVGPGFKVSSQDKIGDIHYDYLVEATGPECNLSRIPSKLLHYCLGSKLIEADPYGGIRCDYATSQVSEGLYVMGSLTRGTHFYTTAIDRNVAHAERIVDSIVGEPARRSMHVALFVGTDISSQLMVSKLVPQLLSLGHMPYVFLPAHSSSKKASRFELKELAFFERGMLQDHIIPFLRDFESHETPNLTVEQLRGRYGVFVEKIADINDPHFLEELSSHHIDVGISIRCYQKFGRGIIRFFDSPRFGLLNLHPGRLPEYRGVMTMVRAMDNGDREFGFSLHHMNEDWDAGDVIDIETGPIDYERPMLCAMIDLYGIGVGVAMKAFDKLSRGQPLPSVPQDDSKKGYFTFPTQEELSDYHSRGIKLVDARMMHDLLVSTFSSQKTEEQLSDVVTRATSDWYANNAPCKDISRSQDSVFKVSI